MYTRLLSSTAALFLLNRRARRAGAGAADAGLHREVGRQRPARSPVVPADRPGDAVRPRRRFRRARERSDDVLRRDGDGGRLQDRPTRARPSRRCSTTKAPARSAPSRSRRPTRTWCGSAPAKATTARARRGATASTSPPTAAARGRTWASRTASRSRRSSSIRSTSTSSTSRRSAICGPAGGERGVYKTTDGGLTWNRVLHVDDDTGATELVMDPSNNKTLYTATYQRRRQQWGMNGGGAGSNIWKTTDGGVTWTKLESGIPSRTRRAASASTSIAATRTSLYARVEHETESGVYRSDNGGATWRKMSDDQSAADVFRRDQDRSADRLAHLRARRLAAHLRRRRQDVPRRRRRAHSRRSSRAVDQPEGSAPPDHRQRRRRQHLARSIGDLGVAAEPPRRAGVSRRVRHADAVSRLRRPAGQQHVVRAERGAHQQRRHQRRLVRDQRRRRFPAADGSDRRAHRLRGIAGRPHEPHRSVRRTSARPCGRSRRSRSPANRPACIDSTGTRRCSCRRSIRRRSTSAPTSC